MPAHAGNLGFETGDLTDWSTNGPAGALTGYGAFAPASGTYLGAIAAGLGQDTYTTLSQTFTLGTGGTISGFAGFQANDYLPFNDSAYLAVNGVHLLDWNVGSVGDYGNSGWNAFNFTALTAGSYTLELGVANHGDNGFSSGAVLDAVSVTPGNVPEPASWAMMVGGFGLVGAGMRARTRKLSFAA
jgi:hypothetical protein